MAKRTHNMCCVPHRAARWSHRRAGTSTVGAAVPPCHPPNGAHFITAGSRSLPCLPQTRHAPACERSEHPRCLSPPDSGSGTECSESGGARTIPRGRAEPRSVVKWSELKRTESGSLRRQSACAGAWAKRRPRRARRSIVAGAPASCARPRSLPTHSWVAGSRHAACAVAGTRRSTLPPNHISAARTATRAREQCPTHSALCDGGPV